jgi:Spy/CpxP family protein refolding chaperone
MTSRSVVSARLLTGLMLVTFVVLAAASAFAQPPRMSAEERTKKLTEQLTLNEDQAKKVLAIYKRSEADMRKIFESAEGDRESMRETMRGHREKINKEIEALLTAEQKTKFEEIKKQGPPPRGGDRRPPEGH